MNQTKTAGPVAVVRRALEASGGRLGVRADTIGRGKDGTVVLRRGFFYRMGGSADDFAARVGAALMAADVRFVIVEATENWKPFRGGASVANGSNWTVRVRVLPAAAKE